MKAYKKRMKGSWNCGKRNKGDGEERQYAKREIKALQAQMKADYQEKHHKGKRTRNPRARLEHRIAWYEERIAWYERQKADYTFSTCSYFRDSLREAKKELKELIAKEKAK